MLGPGSRGYAESAAEAIEFNQYSLHRSRHCAGEPKSGAHGRVEKREQGIRRGAGMCVLLEDHTPRLQVRPARSKTGRGRDPQTRVAVRMLKQSRHELITL